MSGSLIAAGLLMGLASTPHCALMCGAPCAAISRSCGGVHSNWALLAWHAGRAVAYIAAGAVAATAVGLIARWSAGSALVRPLWTLLQAGVLALGLALLVSGRMPNWVNGFSQALNRSIAPGVPSKFRGMRRAAVLGLGWVAMPCAVLYGALAMAALGAAAWDGAAVMAAFSLGSAAGLAGVPYLWLRLSRLPQSAALRMAGATLAAGSVWSLWHGLEGASGAWCVT